MPISPPILVHVGFRHNGAVTTEQSKKSALSLHMPVPPYRS